MWVAWESFTSESGFAGHASLPRYMPMPCMLRTFSLSCSKLGRTMFYLAAVGCQVSNATVYLRPEGGLGSMQPLTLIGGSLFVQSTRASPTRPMHMCGNHPIIDNGLSMVSTICKCWPEITVRLTPSRVEYTVQARETSHSYLRLTISCKQLCINKTCRAVLFCRAGPPCE